MVIVRPATVSDLSALLGLRELAGPGFTSLAVGEDLLARRLSQSEASFAADVEGPHAERYVLMLENTLTGAVIGTAQVKATVGLSAPFFNFKILSLSQASNAAARRFDLDVLFLVNEFTGCSEVGSLFVRSDHRHGGVGRMLAQARYLLMAAAPHRFSRIVVSELRGVVSPDGRSPFWENLGRHFFRMEFQEADRLSATTDNQFITDLMPKFPIYVDLLPQEARAVIGQCHPEGVGARRLLEWEGFTYNRVVDIFEGGPLVSAPRDDIRTMKESRRVILAAGEPLHAARRALLSTDRLPDFRVVQTLAAKLPDGRCAVSFEAREALGLKAGDHARIWMDA